jgi:hypothetical protein
MIRMMKSRRMRLAGHVAQMVEKENLYKIFVGKPEEKRPLGRHRWVDNIVTCYLGSQPIQRFVARQQLRNMQQVLEKLLSSRPV